MTLFLGRNTTNEIKHLLATTFIVPFGMTKVSIPFPNQKIFFVGVRSDLNHGMIVTCSPFFQISSNAGFIFFIVQIGDPWWDLCATAMLNRLWL